MVSYGGLGSFKKSKQRLCKANVQRNELRKSGLDTDAMTCNNYPQSTTSNHTCKMFESLEA